MDRKKSRRVSVMQFNDDMDEMEDANFDRSRYRRKSVSSRHARNSGYNDDMLDEYEDREQMKSKKQRRMTQFTDEQMIPAGWEGNDDTFNQMAQRKLSRATNRSFGTIDDGASYMSGRSDRSRSLADEDVQQMSKCSTLCKKWTIIVVALMALHVVTLVAIGIFFGEQQKEIDRHDHLLVKLHQRYEKNSRNIQRLGNDMKFIAKDNTEEGGGGGGGHVNLGGGGALYSEMADDIKALKKETDGIQRMLKEQNAEISTLKDINREVDKLIQDRHHNYTSELDSLRDKATKVDLAMKQLEENMLNEVDQITNSSEKARDTIMQLQEELMNEFDILAEKTQAVNTSLYKFSEEAKKDTASVRYSLRQLEESYRRNIQNLNNNLAQENKLQNKFKMETRGRMQGLREDSKAVNKAMQSLRKELKKELAIISVLQSMVKNLQESVHTIAESGSKGGSSSKPVKPSKFVQGLATPAKPSTNVEMRIIQLGADVDEVKSQMEELREEYTAQIEKLRKEFAKGMAVVNVLKEFNEKNNNQGGGGGGDNGGTDDGYDGYDGFNDKPFNSGGGGSSGGGGGSSFENFNDNSGGSSQNMRTSDGNTVTAAGGSLVNIDSSDGDIDSGAGGAHGGKGGRKVHAGRTDRATGEKHGSLGGGGSGGGGGGGGRGGGGRGGGGGNNGELEDALKTLEVMIASVKGELVDIKYSIKELQQLHKEDISTFKTEVADVSSSLVQLLKDYKEDLAGIKEHSDTVKNSLRELSQLQAKDVASLQSGTKEVNSTLVELKTKYDKDVESHLLPFASKAKDHLDQLAEDVPDLQMKVTDVNATMFQLHGIYAKDILIVYNLSVAINNSVDALAKKHKRDEEKTKKDIVKIRKDHTKLKMNASADISLLKVALTEALVTVVKLHENHTRDMGTLNETLDGIGNFQDNVTETIQHFKNSTKKVVKKLYKRLKCVNSNITKLEGKILTVNTTVVKHERTDLPTLNKTLLKVKDVADGLGGIMDEKMPKMNKSLTKMKKTMTKLKEYIGEIPMLKLNVESVNNTVFQLNDIYVKDILVIYNNSVKVSNILMDLRHKHLKDIADVRLTASLMNLTYTSFENNMTDQHHYTRTTLEKLDSYTKNAITDLRLTDDGLHNEVNDLKSADVDQMAMIRDLKVGSAAFTDSINELKKRGYMHYPVQQAIFVGLGKGVTKDDEDATEGIPQKFSTMTSCIMFCKSKKEVDSLFNGARYNIYDGQCYCEKSYVTHKEDQKFLHYWLLHEMKS